MRPRPAILIPLAYGAGLATGLLRFWVPVGVLLLALVLAGRRRLMLRFLSAVAALGCVAGWLAWRIEGDQCSARLPAAELRVTVRLLEPVDAAGSRIEVRPVGAACRGSILARWPARHPLEAGHEAAVEGRWVPRQRRDGRSGGLLVVRRVRPAGGDPGLGDRLRNGIVDASRRLYGNRTAMVEALILGRRAELDDELEDRFAESGLVHLLSISGFHVGLISAWVFLLCRAGRQPRARSLAVAAAVSVAYVAFLGWPAPATRAAALAVVLALGRIRQRQVMANALLAQTCLVVMLVDPWAALDLGAWLSAASLWGATTFARWSDRALAPTVWWRTVTSSTGATLATAPITAAAFGSVAMIGIVLNFAAIPLAAIAVPGVLASIIVWPLWPGLAGALAAGAGLALHLLEGMARLGAAIPGGHIVQAEELRSAVPWLGVLALALWGLGARNTRTEALRRWGWVGGIAAWIALAAALVPGDRIPASNLTLHFLDVGQGDAAAVRTPGGRWVVIDAGPRSARYDAGRRVVVPFLRRHGVRRLAVLVVSHAHADHVGGALAVLDRYPVGFVTEPGDAVPEPLYRDFLGALEAEGVRWHPGRPGDRFEFDGVRFVLLHPDTAWAEWGMDVNEDSLVLLIEFGEFQALFAGDAGFPAEARLRGQVGDVDLLKVGHHGSAGSTSDAWLDELHPRVAVISVGTNRYGHPAPPTLRRLAAHHVRVWRTDRDGTVTVTTDGSRMTVRAGDDVTTFPTASSPVECREPYQSESAC